VLRYRLILAALCGVGFTALVALLLNVPAVAMLALVLLTPGGILGAVLVRSQGLGSPSLVLAANAIIYSAVVCVAFHFWLRPNGRMAQLLTAALAIPVLLLATLACIPSVSPLWPRGMSQLADEEKALRIGLPLGMTLDGARGILSARGVNYYEYEIHTEGPILQNSRATVLAKPGDRLISAQIETNAEQLPCSYKIQVALVFGADDRLRKSYIERSPVCP
jgi:hypothetical protein